MTGPASAPPAPEFNLEVPPTFIATFYKLAKLSRTGTAGRMDWLSDSRWKNLRDDRREAAVSAMTSMLDTSEHRDGVARFLWVPHFGEFRRAVEKAAGRPIPKPRHRGLDMLSRERRALGLL